MIPYYRDHRLPQPQPREVALPFPSTTTPQERDSAHGTSHVSRISTWLRRAYSRLDRAAFLISESLSEHFIYPSLSCSKGHTLGTFLHAHLHDLPLVFGAVVRDFSGHIDCCIADLDKEMPRNQIMAVEAALQVATPSRDVSLPSDEYTYVYGPQIELLILPFLQLSPYNKLIYSMLFRQLRESLLHPVPERSVHVGCCPLVIIRVHLKFRGYSSDRPPCGTYFATCISSLVGRQGRLKHSIKTHRSQIQHTLKHTPAQDGDETRRPRHYFS